MCSESRQVSRSALADRRFRRYFPASWFSSLGSWMLRFLLGWSAWELTGSATWVGAVAALMLAPTFLLSPLFGIVADRVNPRFGLVGSMLIHALISGAGALASFTGHYSQLTLLLLAAAMGGVTSGHTPMRLALIPLLVERSALPSAVGLSAMTFNTARILGPAIGAWLLHRFSVVEAFVFAAVMFTASMLILLSLGGIGHREPAPREPWLRELVAGFRFVGRHPGLRLVFGFTITNGLLGRTLIELLPALSGELLRGGSGALATLTAGAGAGSIVAGLIVSRQRARPDRLLAMVAGALLLVGVMQLAAGAFTDLWLLTGMVATVSLATTLAGTGAQTLIHLGADEAYRGRVLSLWTVLAMGSPALGAALVGASADRLGFVTVLMVSGAAGVLAVAWLYARRRMLLEPVPLASSTTSRSR